ncbi:MAG: MoaD/ThiS family protein [Firmicutes bacterium]|nr:MoaD/ThiS family protein [Bacillota bacterium]
MVKIKLFGSLRLKTGCKGLDADVPDVKSACRLLADTTGHNIKEFKNCVVIINGKQAKHSSKLKDGDELVLMAAAGGG